MLGHPLNKLNRRKGFNLFWGLDEIQFKKNDIFYYRTRI